jgi:hypothetical protein
MKETLDCPFDFTSRCTMGNCDCKPKQETFKEAALKYAESNQYDLEYYDEGGYQGIEVESFAKKLVDFTSKWQAERMYSEEDMKSAIEKTVEQCNKMMQESYGLLEIDVDYIFEQFKKK